MKPLSRMSASVTLGCLVLMLGACSGGNGEELDENGQSTSHGVQGTDTESNTVTGADLFTRIQNDILTPDCATSGCHAGTTSPLGLNLSAGQAYASLVRKDSSQVSGLMLVEPSNADASYLVQKLEGTQGGGAQMPMGKPALKTTDLALVREWIQAGALDAQANTADTGTGNDTGENTSGAGSGGPVATGDAGDTTNAPATLAGIQEDVFDIHCAGCHGGASPSSDLDLSAGNSYTQLVGRYAAMGADGQQLIVPGDAVNSFLIDKLRGENLGAGNEKGRRMPLFGDPLDEATVQRIERWINTGAEEN